MTLQPGFQNLPTPAEVLGSPAESARGQPPEPSGIGPAVGLEASLQAVAEKFDQLISGFVPDLDAEGIGSVELTITDLATIVAAIVAVAAQVNDVETAVDGTTTAINTARIRGHREQLGQLRPANTTAASIYSPTASKRGRITNLEIANVSGASAKYSVFHDDDGTTYDETTAVRFEVEVPAGAADTINCDWGISDDGNLAVKTDTADAFCFTVYGDEEIDE